jgi:hypothetical protein
MTLRLMLRHGPACTVAVNGPPRTDVYRNTGRPRRRRPQRPSLGPGREYRVTADPGMTLRRSCAEPHFSLEQTFEHPDELDHTFELEPWQGFTPKRQQLHQSDPAASRTGASLGTATSPLTAQTTVLVHSACRVGRGCQSGRQHSAYGLTAFPGATLEDVPTPAEGLAIRPFDKAALHAALDEKRIALGLSWQRVADQMWAQSAALNGRRRDHPISPSTLTNVTRSTRTSCQRTLFMLRWLGRPPESGRSAAYTLKRNSTTSPSRIT